MTEPLLQISNLRTQFTTDGGIVRAVDGVSFEVGAGEVVGLVGESGCGKSATGLSIMGLLPKPYGKIAGGHIVFEGKDLARASEAELRRMRGNRIAMIFQDPMTSLNPYLRVGEQLLEVTALHLGLSKAEGSKRAIEVLEQVGISDAPARLGSYPHELSGGMRQRVMIAMALLCDPALLIADEPTTALDVTIQAQILELLLALTRDRQLSIILITHDLGVVARTCDRVLVMYAGRLVESASSKQLFTQPMHPYTSALMHSVPRVDRRHQGRLQSIEGLPPRLDGAAFSACTFTPRCPLVQPGCREKEPELERIEPNHWRRCILPKADLVRFHAQAESGEESKS